jgi:ABC-type antimicrobial peptide transport system permease subunit
MIMGESVADALAEVRAHKVRTVLQTLGVVLGVGSLVAVQGLTDAGRRQALKFFDEFGGLTKLLVVNKPLKETVQTARQRASNGLTWDDARAIKREIASTTQVDPLVMLELPVRFGDYLRRHRITGATPDYPQVYKFFPARGRFLIEDDMHSQARVCVLGDSAARTYFGNEDPLGKTLYLDNVGFRVVGIMKRKEFYFNEASDNALEWMNRMTIIPLTAVYARFSGDPEKRVEYVNVMVDKVGNNHKTSEAVTALLYRRHGGVLDFEVYNREERLKQRQEQNMVFNVTFLVTGIISLIVGGIVIMNIMLASFRERIREVGVRKALGARGIDVAWQFLVEAVLVTSLGGAFGLLMGIGLAKGITALLGQPAIITPAMAAIGVIASVATGLFFGLYPAIKAARLNPVDALRYE